MMVTVKELEAIVPFILVFDRKLSLFSYRVKKIQIAIVNDHAENLGKEIWVYFAAHAAIELSLFYIISNLKLSWMI